MKRFLSLIVVLMLAFNVKAQSFSIATEDDSDVCTIVIEMFDSYGDGWGTDLLVYSLNGSEDEFLEFTEKESSKIHTLEVSKGSHLVIKFYGKNMYGENSIKISYQDGDVLYEASSEEGSPNYLDPNNWSDAVFVDTIVDCGGENEGGDDNTGDEGDEGDDNTGDDNTGDEGDDNTGDEGGDDNTGDEGDDDNEEPVKPEIPNVVATATETTITLTWDAVEGATSYNIYTPSSFSYNVYGITETTYTFEGLTASTEYCFEVSAVYPTDESDQAEACATTQEGEEPGDEPEYPEQTTVPAAPVIKVYAENSGLIVIEWEAVETAIFYYVYHRGKLVGDGKVMGTEVEILVNPETEYCFTVTAVNTVGESEHSNEACATTPAEEGEEPENPDGNIELAENNFNIYPNPVNDRLYIEAETEIKEVVVYDVYGRRQNLRNSETQKLRNSIDATELNSGVYFVKVVTEKGEAIKRFIKK